MDGPAIAALILALLAILFVPRPLFGRVAGPPEDESASPLETLRREKDGIYLAMREVEFDRRTEVVSEEDYRALMDRYRARAIALMKEIDRLEAALPAGAAAPAAAGARRCDGCGADNAEEHRFCIVCGRPLDGDGGSATEKPAEGGKP